VISLDFSSIFSSPSTIFISEPHGLTGTTNNRNADGPARRGIGSDGFLTFTLQFE